MAQVKISDLTAATSVADGDEFELETGGAAKKATAAQIAKGARVQDKMDATTAPGATDDSAAGYAVGSKWVNTVADKAYICVDATATAAVWKEISPDIHASNHVTGGADKVRNATAAQDGLATAAQITKLDGVEALADVTDAANVGAAGAVMDSDIAPAEGFLRKTGAGAYTAHKSNLAAGVAPGATDDSAAGYSVGSRWIDTTADKEYVCLDATASAAVWTETTAGAAGGEANTASNQGAGVGPFDGKVGVDLEFRTLIAVGPVKITLDGPNKEIDVDIERGVETKSANYTTVAGDDGKLFLLDGASVTVTVTLLAAATAGAGHTLAFKAIDVTNVLTIDGNAAETIDGAATITLDTVGDTVVLVCDGTNWRIKADKTNSIASLVEDTTPELGGNLNVGATPKAIVDNNGNELLVFSSITNAVNHIEIRNQTSVNDPRIRAVGDATNIDLQIEAKGTGAVKFVASDIDVTGGNILVSGTVDGRDVATDGTKLDGIETAATKSTGKHTMPVPASAIFPATTNGCAALAQLETATNKVNTKHLAFDGAAQEYAHFEFPAPKSSDEASTFTITLKWSHPAATAFGVVWELEMLARSNNDALDAAWGTAVTVTDTGGATDDLYASPESAAITPGGAWAEGDTILLRIGRKVADAGDTLDADARLHGIEFNITTNAATDA